VERKHAFSAPLFFLLQRKIEDVILQWSTSMIKMIVMLESDLMPKNRRDILLSGFDV